MNWMIQQRETNPNKSLDFTSKQMETLNQLLNQTTTKKEGEAQETKKLRIALAQQDNTNY